MYGDFYSSIFIDATKVTINILYGIKQMLMLIREFMIKNQ